MKICPRSFAFLSTAMSLLSATCVAKDAYYTAKLPVSNETKSFLHHGPHRGSGESQGRRMNMRNRRHQIPNDITYPAVFSAVVMKPNYFQKAEDASKTTFISEVDLIGVPEPARASSDADSLAASIAGLGEDSFMKIEFIVHGSDEHAYLESMIAHSPEVDSAGHASDMIVDPIKSQLLQHQPDDDSSQGQGLASQPTYATIPGYSCYRSLDGMKVFLQDMAQTVIPNLNITVVDIGKSFLGIDIMVLVMTGNGVAAKGRSTTKGVFFAICGIHAREYTPPELCARFAETLRDGYNNDAYITSILDHNEIHLLPHVNPDGRVRAENGYFTRKNRHQYGSCSENNIGVDLNRNFPFKFGGTGSSGYVCSSTYRGPSAASEPETQAVVNYARQLFHKNQCKKDDEDPASVSSACSEDTVGVFFDIHSYGEIIIWPYGFANEGVLTANDVEFEALGRKMRHYNKYALAGPGKPDFLYAVSGATDDWAYGELGALGYAFELGTSFFQDCSVFEEITDNIVDRNIPALLYAASVSKTPYKTPKGPEVTSLTMESTAISLSQELVVTATVDDMAFLLQGSESSFSTGASAISDVLIYFDEHPDDLPTPTGIRMNAPYSGTRTETATISLDVQNLSQYLDAPVVGRHVLHVCGVDTAANGKGPYAGPVKSIYFDVVSFATPSPTTSYTPSVIPTMSSEPSSLPSSFPSTIPSSLPSSFPSTSPSFIPSITPSESFIPSATPSESKSSDPSSVPSSFPSIIPSSIPSTSPSESFVPSATPSESKSSEPSSVPSTFPSTIPSLVPSSAPSKSSIPSATPSQSIIPTGSQLTWTTITSDDFESSWGSFSDGGSDARRHTFSYSHQGSYSVRIRDNARAGSSFYHTTSHDVSGFSDLRVQFWFIAISMESGEDFFLEYSSSGASWVIWKAWVAGGDFGNNVFKYVDEIFPKPIGTTDIRLRFRCDASTNNDRIFIDEVVFEGK